MRKLFTILTVLFVALGIFKDPGFLPMAIFCFVLCLDFAYTPKKNKF